MGVALDIKTPQRQLTIYDTHLKKIKANPLTGFPA
jgi:hypothetical protein